MTIDEGGDDSRRLIERAVDYAFTADPAAYLAYVGEKRRAHPHDSPRELAERIVQTYAQKGALEGFVTGLPANPVLAVGGAVADMAVLLRFYTTLTAVVGYLADEKYFDDPDWRHHAFFVLAGPKVVARVIGDAARAGGKQVSKRVIRRYLSKGVLAALKRFLLKWFGKKVTQRAIIAKTIPLVGGLIGGVWNYSEIAIIGKRIVRYHFDEVLE